SEDSAISFSARVTYSGSIAWGDQPTPQRMLVLSLRDSVAVRTLGCFHSHPRLTPRTPFLRHFSARKRLLKNNRRGSFDPRMTAVVALMRPCLQVAITSVDG